MWRRLALALLVFVVAVFPWPHLDSLYARGVATVGNALLPALEGGRLLRFEAPPVDVPTPFTLSVLLAAPTPAGDKLAGRRLAFDTRSIGWLPSAFGATLIAGLAATWRQRLLSWAVGLALLQTYSALIIANSVACETLQDGWWTAARSVASCLRWVDEVAVIQLGLGFVIPLAVAGLCVGLLFRRA